jgi:hypothetical protein
MPASPRRRESQPALPIPAHVVLSPGSYTTCVWSELTYNDAVIPSSLMM